MECKGYSSDEIFDILKNIPNSETMYSYNKEHFFQFKVVLTTGNFIFINYAVGRLTINFYGKMSMERLWSLFSIEQQKYLAMHLDLFT